VKIFVINLSHRDDRRQHIIKQLENYNYEIVQAVDGYKTDFEINGIRSFRRWIDPLLNRPMTPGETGCAISHLNVWKKIAELDEPAIILEDDSVLNKEINFKAISSILNESDMVYLGYKEMSNKQLKTVSAGGVEVLVPVYPYHTNAYALTPQFAKYLISLNYENRVIPLDEFFALINDLKEEDYLSDNSNIKDNLNFLKSKFFKDRKKIVALKNTVISQASREEFGTDIEGQYLIGILSIVTAGTDESKMSCLFSSLMNNKSQVFNLGKDKKWLGGDVTNGPGGGQKVNLLYNFLKTQPDNSVVLFVDAYDVFFTESKEEIFSRFFKSDCDILFAAEKSCWPDSNLKELFLPSSTPYRFLNSGSFIGYRWALLRLIENEINNTDDDQLFYHKKYLSNLNGENFNVKLDTNCYIFQCLGGAESDVEVVNSSKIVNKITGNYPCVIHGNGGPNTKIEFLKLFNNTYNTVNILPSTTKLSVVGPDIIAGDFLNIFDSYEITHMAERSGKWKSMDGDKFPGQEIRVKELSPELFSIIEQHLLKVIGPALEKHWFPLHMYGIRDMFIIKYTPETQSSLNCHHDASLVSAIVKLNGEYTGGDTYFYRQNYSNAEVNVGDIVLWPGQVTHGHEGRPVTSGTKYNLVIWTSRYPGDVNE